MNYNKRLRDLREDHDLKQETVAILLKVDQSYYSKYERGKIPLPIEHLITLCRYYNVSSDYILGLSDDPRPLKPK